MKPRFLLCPAALSVRALKKFVRLKFDLEPKTPVRIPLDDLLTSHIRYIMWRRWRQCYCRYVIKNIQLRVLSDYKTALENLTIVWIKFVFDLRSQIASLDPLSTALEGHTSSDSHPPRRLNPSSHPQSLISGYMPLVMQPPVHRLRFTINFPRLWSFCTLHCMLTGRCCQWYLWQVALILCDEVLRDVYTLVDLVYIFHLAPKVSVTAVYPLSLSEHRVEVLSPKPRSRAKV